MDAEVLIEVPVLRACLLELPHRPDLLWEQEDTSSLTCRRKDSGFWDLPIDPRVLQQSDHAGFYGVSRIGFIRLDHSLVIGLVEWWRQETHTFHILVGECTITLQDVSVLLGLRVDGAPVIDHDRTHSAAKWQQVCFELLGVAPADEDFEIVGRLRASWFQEHLCYYELKEIGKSKNVS